MLQELCCLAVLGFQCGQLVQHQQTSHCEGCVIQLLQQCALSVSIVLQHTHAAPASPASNNNTTSSHPTLPRAHFASECAYFAFECDARHTFKSKMLLELTAGLVVISIALTPDLSDWGKLLGPLGTFMSPWLAG